jgi:predicted MFS family arabinose efflux permease
MHEASLAVGFAAGSLGGGLVSLWLGSRAPYQTVALVVLLTAAVQAWVHWKRNEE